MKILIIIPTYNEEKNIEIVVDNIIKNYKEYDYLIINDCSTDGTRDICQKKGYNFLDLASNLGIGGGVQAGYLYSAQNAYDLTVQLDGDGQHEVGEIKKLVKEMEKSSANMVTGSRFIDIESFTSSGIRRLGIKFLNKMIYFLTGEKVTDSTSGFRVCDKELCAFFAENYAKDYPEPEAIVAASVSGFKISEVGTVMYERKEGSSTIAGLSPIYYMIKVTMALFCAKIKYKKGVRNGSSS